MDQDSRPIWSRRQRRADWRWPVASGLALAACVALLYAALSGVCRVRQVEVVGSNLPVDAIVAAAGVNGQNLFTVQSDQVVSRVSSIRAIVVRRVDTAFPDRVTIYARLRTSLVAWRAGPALYELDPDGRIVRQVDSTSLPIIRGASAQPGPAIIQAVRYAVQTLPLQPRGAIAAFLLDPSVGLVIVGRAGWRADVGRGSPQTLVNRIATLAGVLQAIRNRPQHLNFVELRAWRPYVRFSGA